MTSSERPKVEERYRVGDLIVDFSNRTFERNGNVTALPNLSFKLFQCLIRHSPDSVDSETLVNEVWGRTTVSPETVTQRVKLLRDAIGDDHQSPQFIETKRGYGYRLIPPVETVAQIHTGKRNRVRVLLPALTLGVIGLGLFYSLSTRHSEKSDEMFRSIAVLPFENMSSDPDQDYFSDGLADELLHLLAQVPGLHVAARTSSFSFKGENADIPTIAKKLRVSHVLEGGVRKSGNTMRITVQLIKAEDGYHLWSETYERTVKDVFSVQQEIAASVVNALQVQLLNRPLLVRQTSPDVYTLYLKARYFDNLKGKENWKKAVANYQKALAIDADYAPAWAGLSVTYRYQANVGLRDFNEGMASARIAAERALALDDNLAVAWASLGQIEMLSTWDWRAADRAIQKALQLEPGNADVLTSASGLAVILGRVDEAIALLQRATALDPLSQSPQNALGLAYMSSGQLDEAERALRQLLELNPEYPWGLVNLGRVQLLNGEAAHALASFERSADGLWRDSGIAMALSTLGRFDEAQSALASMEQKYSQTGAFQVAAVHAWRGDIDSAFEWLGRSYELHETGLVFVPSDRFFAGLHDDPRWPVLLDRMGLLHQGFEEY